MTTKEVEKGISEIVGALADPILVWPGGWGDTIPEWLKNAITLERLTMNIKALKGEAMTGTESEACAYLMTASLTFPLDHDWAQIYLYVASQTYKRQGKGEMPADIAVNQLDAGQKHDLRRLQDWLYEHRTRLRKGQERAARRQKKEEAAASQSEQMIFEF